MIENIFCPNCNRNIADQLENITITPKHKYMVSLPHTNFYDLKCKFCCATLTATVDYLLKDVFGKPYLEAANITIHCNY